MTDTQLQTELAEARREIQRLRERLSVGAPTVRTDLSLCHLTQRERQQIEPVLMKYAHDGNDEESNEFKNTFRKRSNESSYARFENLVRLVSRSPTRTRGESGERRRAADSAYTSSRIRSRHYSSQRSEKSATLDNRARFC